MSPAAAAPLTNAQPKHGDVIVCCEHVDNDGCNQKVHFWLAPDGLPFARPNGSRGVAKWIVACATCACRASFEPLKIPIVADGTWTGDAPVIEASS